MSVHLFVRSSYSFLESSISINSLINKAKQENVKHLCLTDYHVMYGVPEFLNACNKNNIYPIVGLEVDVDFHNEQVPFVLLSSDNLGYLNLMKISSYYGEGHSILPFNYFLKWANHNIIIAYGEGGYCDSELINDNRDALQTKIKQLKNELPPFYFALSYQETSLWKSRNKTLKLLANANGIKTVALNKIYYLEKDDEDLYRCLLGIKLDKKINDNSLQKIKGRYFLSDEEMANLYDNDDIERTEEIANECKADGNLGKTNLPAYKNKENVSSDIYLKALCYAGLKKRLNNVINEKYKNRLDYELSIITKMNFENYFLIVYDFVKFAKKQNILIGPGRGSAAGSLVSYCLGIIDIDPIKYDLLFERFLNPERITLPDIDIDIPDNRRKEVIEYIYNRYGSEHVADIVTFDTFGVRQSIRDVGNYLNISDREIESILRCISKFSKLSLNEEYEENERLKRLISSNNKYINLYNLAIRLNGLLRHSSTHPAGVLISAKPISEIIPTVHNSELLTSQFSSEYLEERGLVKMDLLSLKYLNVIDEIVHNIGSNFNIKNIPLDDQNTYKILANGDTSGIFQFESNGMKSLLRRIKPQEFKDIVATNALFRPASKDSIDNYINAKNGNEIHYPVKELEPILKETYGIMIYQEQAMLASQICAGFSLSKADVLRKAMSKKNINDLQKLKSEFITGCLNNNYSNEIAEMLFDMVSRFGGYGFNKSHAVAYAMISYQMAYLKANYPCEFYLSLLNSAIGDGHKTGLYVNEIKRRGFNINYPNINSSESIYKITNKTFNMPLSHIKGIGNMISNKIIDERNKNGLYQDLFDFVARCLLLKLNKDYFVSLINAGALDCFGYNRMTLLNNLDQAIRFGHIVQVSNNDNISVNLNLVSKPKIVNAENNIHEQSVLEMQTLGFCLGDQPITILRNKLNIDSLKLNELINFNGYGNGFAQINYVNARRTKKGDMMAFLKISDETTTTELIVMPSLYSKVSNLLVRGAYINFRAKISPNDSMIAETINRINDKEA